MERADKVEGRCLQAAGSLVVRVSIQVIQQGRLRLRILPEAARTPACPGADTRRGQVRTATVPESTSRLPGPVSDGAKLTLNDRRERA